MEKKLSIVIPCYNEEQSIEKTVLEIFKELESFPSWEVILVDDGSTDRSYAIIDNLTERLDNVHAVQHDRRLGYGAALKSGIRYSRADSILILDADGTYPCDKIVTLVKMIESCDMVVGSRSQNDGHSPFIRKIPKLFLRLYAQWVADRPIPDLNSGMRVMKKDIVKKFISVLPDGFSFTTTITLAMMTNHFNVKFEPINYRKRIGRSKIRPIRDTANFFFLILRTGIYFAPLKVFSPVIIVSFLGLLISSIYDIIILSNLSDKTILFLVIFLMTSMFALLADMIDKRTQR